MDAETIQLILDMGATGANVNQVTERLQALHAAASKVADEYQVLDAKAGTYAVSTAQVDSATEKAVQAAVAQTHAQRALAIALDETAKKGKEFGSVSRDMQMRILNTGRAAQDLAQGGFGAILNNIEGLVGGSGVLAGALTLLGTAVLVSKPYWEGWLKQLGDAKEKIPQSSDKIEAMTEALKAQKHALEELKKQGELNYFDMQKYGKLVAEITQEEADLAEARLARSVGDHESKGHRERAGAFREQLAEYGGSNKILEVLQNAGLKEKEAEDLVADALKGIKGAAERIADLSAPAPKSSQFHYTSPDRKRHDEQMAKDGEKHDRIMRQMEEHEAKARAAAAKEQQAQAKKAEHSKALDEHKEEGRVREDQKLGRKIGDAFERPRTAVPRDALGKVPLLRTASEEELDAALVANQAQMVGNQAALEQQLQQARRIGQQARRTSQQLRQPQVDPGVF